LAEFVAAGLPTLAFVPSRRGVEWVAAQAQDLLAGEAGDPAGKVLAYRAGFLPEERRDIEARLRSGDLVGVATTNALEVGMDISGLDAVVICGWPGRRTSFWQQAGRAGRAGRDSLVVLVAADDPLDSYLVAHPEAVFGEPLEVSVIDPANPSVLAPHLCAAAAELPLTEEDLRTFGESATTVADELVTTGLLRRRPRGLFWTDRHRPVGLSDIRAIGGSAVQIVEQGTGRLLGTVDAAQAGRTVHAGAVYIHQGSTFLVDELRLDESVALVHQEVLEYTTMALSTTSLRVTSEAAHHPLGRGRFSRGDVLVTSQVHSYLRRRADTLQVIGSEPLDLPMSTLATSACWWSLPDGELTDIDDLAGAVHAAEHAAIGLLPLVVSCDRWDVGGLSTEAHPDTLGCTAFVYDAYPGGAGFSRGGFDRVAAWLPATRRAILECPCASGCPRCIQSPKCGNGNEPLDKVGAAQLLHLLE
jgi:DEAD/DEAH box helicase domain-containing protein